jgi:hypothetical protein
MVMYFSLQPAPQRIILSQQGKGGDLGYNQNGHGYHKEYENQKD